MNFDELQVLTNDELDEALYRARDSLNTGQLGFSDRVLQGTNATEAARDAGYAEKSAHVTANRLLRNAKVSLVLAFAREQHRRVHNLDINWSMRKLHEVMKKSLLAGEMTAAINAIKEINKLLDLYPDVKSTVEVINKIDFTTLSDDYWGALVAYKHELVEPPVSH